nr:CHAP domain-containing protein [Oscillibacter sp. MSJ-31]
MEDALQQKRQVSFKYFDLDENAHKVFRRDGLLYVMEPISLVFNEDNYSPLWMSVIYGIKLGGSGGSDDIVAVALSQIGNVGGEPYWSWYGFNSRVEWCACFVSWCANECGYIESGAVPLYAYCPFGVDWFKSHCQWMDGSEAPEPGMIIFFDWDDRGSSGKQDGSADHTGIVERVEDGIVYTVEGNSSDGCRERQYAVGHHEILGYGVISG